MTPRADHAREIKLALADPTQFLNALGLLSEKKAFQRQAGGYVIRCLVHEDRSPSCSVQNRHGVLLWRCHGCGADGDALSLIALKHGLGLKRDFREVLRMGAEMAGLWGIVAELDGKATTEDRPRPAPPLPATAPDEPERAWPDAGEVERFWGNLVPVTDEWEVAEWLRSRNVDPDVVDGRELARALGNQDDCPAWGVCRGGTWAQVGYRLIVPMFDAEGKMRSVRASRVVAGAENDPKCRPPFGHKASGLVMADAFALAYIRGERQADRFVICEGESDWLTWATRTKDPNTGVFGIVTGSWTASLTARLPKGAKVIIRTDPDPAGEKYAREIAASLKGRCFVSRAA